MADPTCTPWRITHGTTVLCDFADKLPAEPDFGFGKEVEVAPVVRGKHPAIFDRGNVQHDLSWSRIVRKGSVEAARAWRLSHDIEVANLGKGDIIIQIKNGATYKLKDAVVQSMTTTTGRSVSNSSWDVLAEYSVVGGALSKL